MSSKSQNVQVGIIMGSDSDLKIMKKTAEQLDAFGVSYEITIASAHRTPRAVSQFVRNMECNGAGVIIAGAGMAAALPGVIAGETTLPVIGVPIKGGALDGIDALLSIAQMPPGVPVATVGLNGAKNAGILAAQIVGAMDNSLREKITAFKNNMRAEVDAKSEKLQNLGYEKYLAQMPKK